MTNLAATYAQFGQALGFAERTLSALLREHLAERGTTPETWYTLQLIATRGPQYPREELLSPLAESRSFTAELARELVPRLAAEGLIRGDATLDLTPDGQALHRSLRESLAGPSTELLSQLPLADVETTVRTLQAITRLAVEEAEPAA